MTTSLQEVSPLADREFVSLGVVTWNYLPTPVSVPGRGQRAAGWTVESSPIRMAVTSAWARLAAPSFW